MGHSKMIYLGDRYYKEIRSEAKRLGLSNSGLMKLAWKIARERMKKLPDIKNKRGVDNEQRRE